MSAPGQERVPRDPVGLCRSCRNARIVPAGDRQYWLCRVAAVDARFERYPRLPVIACRGYASGPPEAPPGG
jgi:hypothetical protein